MTNRILIALGLAATCVSPSIGQVLVPPPAAKEPSPEYTPPEPPSTRRVPQRTTRPQPQPRRMPQSEAPNIPFRSAARPIEVGPNESYDGPVIRYEQPMQFVAIQRNPLIKENAVEGLRQIMAERREQMEPLVITHLDTVMDIRSGIIDTLTIQDMENMGQVTAAIQPLVITEPFMSTAQDRGVITAPTNALHQKIVREYQTTLQAEVAENDPDAVTDFFLKFVLRDGLYEAENAYVDLLAEGTTRWDKVLADLDIPSDVKQALKKVSFKRGALEGDLQARSRAASQVELAWRPLNLEQRKSLLRKIVETRGDEGPILPTISTDRPTDARIDDAGSAADEANKR